MIRKETNEAVIRPIYPFVSSVVCLEDQLTKSDGDWKRNGTSIDGLIQRNRYESHSRYAVCGSAIDKATKRNGLISSFTLGANLAEFIPFYISIVVVLIMAMAMLLLLFLLLLLLSYRSYFVIVAIRITVICKSIRTHVDAIVRGYVT